MPDPAPDLKRKPAQARRRPGHSFPPGCYAELHCKTNFSFLEGASHADELVVQAAELGYRALAITDRHSLAGVVRAHAAAKESDLRLLIGAEITPGDALRVVLLATDRQAYGRLCRLITLGCRCAPKGECQLRFEDVTAHAEGLLALVSPGEGERLCTAAPLQQYREVFADRCSLLAELHYGTDDQGRLEALTCLSRQARVPLVAAGDVHHHVRERLPLQHVLTAIREGTTVSELGNRRLTNAERHLRSLQKVHEVFARTPAAIQRTVELADRCQFSLDELRYEYPREMVPGGETPSSYLRRLAEEGARRRYAGTIPAKVQQQLAHELDLIEELRYEAYFLTVYDLVTYARSRNIFCQGRGSAANSAVCYCLGVTAVDPLSTDLLFERFVSRDRNEAPDIDIDFEHERREEVLQYVYEKYGRDRAGMTAEVITYRLRSAIRDVGKALGLSLDRVDALARNVDFRSEETLLAKRCEQSGIASDSRVGQQLILLVQELRGFPRHLSQHVGGLVISQQPLCELVPIENASMADRTVIQWDKDDLDELGILKVDCLALGMLTAIHKSFDLIEQHYGGRLSIDDFTHDEDPAVYDMICRADTVGVFQIESRAQMSMLPRLKPRRFYDLVIEVAIVRPGPIQGNMVHPYLRRREGLEEESYPNDAIRGVLHRTLGVPLFQEQAMQLAVVAAGFTPGQADQLRRAMGGWRRPGLIDTFRRKLLDGMREKGYSCEFAENLFQQIRGFGEYGFPESHAASFARLVYVSAWLKHYHPAAFTAALINSQPMGFYAPAQLIQDARSHGVPVLPVDVNFSNWDCTLEATAPRQSERHFAVRLGMRLVRGLRQSAALAIVEARSTPYCSISELTTRAGVTRPIIERLSAADAFASLNLDRRRSLWEALDQAPSPGIPTLFSSLAGNDIPLPAFPTLTPQANVFADYGATGLSLKAHPLSFYREELTGFGVVPAVSLRESPTDQPVKVAGLVLMRQRPSTAKGITFVTIEDETGTANLVIHADVWQRFDLVARRAQALIVQGRLERQHEVIHVIVHRMEDMADRLESIHHRSRDFR